MISFSGINLLAVLSAGVITFFLGAVWYMPLFGKLEAAGFIPTPPDSRHACTLARVFLAGFAIARRCYRRACAAGAKLSARPAEA